MQTKKLRCFERSNIIFAPIMRMLCLMVFVFTCWQSAAETYSVFEENGKVGLKDQHGNVIIPASYEALGWTSGPFSLIERVTGYQINGKWGLINLENHRITKPAYSSIFPGEGSILVAYKKSELSLRHLAGCINTSGKEVIPFQYDGLKISGFRAIVYTKSESKFKYGLIGLDNKTIIPLQYQGIRSIGSLRYAVENTSGKIALFSENGEQVTEFVIDYISPFKKNYALIYQNYRLGLINRDGTIKLESKYREISVDDNGKIKACPVHQWSVLDGQNNFLQKIEADSIAGLNNNIFKLAIGGKVQLVNDRFKPITEQIFSDVGEFKNHVAIYTTDDGQGIITAEGKILIENIYNRLIITDEHIRAFQKKQNGWSLLDLTGNKLTTKNYQHIDAFNGSFFPVKYRNYWGGVNAAGQEIISCVYDSLLEPKHGQVVVKFKGQYGIISVREDWLVTPQPQKLSIINNERYFSRSENTTYLKSLDGSIIYFTENPIIVKEDFLEESVSTGGLWRIDLNGRIISRQLPPEEPFEFVYAATEGLRGIKRNGRFGFVDDQGRLRIANRYEDIHPFHENLAAVKIRGRWGFIDHAERLVIQPAYDEVSFFQYGICIVKQKDHYGLIDISGKMVLPARYEQIVRLPNRRFVLLSEGFQGLADTDGQLLFTPKFHSVSDLNNGYVIVEREKKFGLLTLQGLSTIPLIYDYLTYDERNDRYFALKRSAWEEIK